MPSDSDNPYSPKVATRFSREWMLSLQVQGNAGLAQFVQVLVEAKTFHKRAITTKEQLKELENFVEDKPSSGDLTSFLVELRNLPDVSTYNLTDFATLAERASRIKSKVVDARAMLKKENSMRPNNSIILKLACSYVNEKTRRIQRVVKDQGRGKKGKRKSLDVYQVLLNRTGEWFTKDKVHEGTEAELDQIWDICEYLLEEPDAYLRYLSRELDSKVVGVLHLANTNPRERIGFQIHGINMRIDLINHVTKSFRERFSELESQYPDELERIAGKATEEAEVAASLPA